MSLEPLIGRIYGPFSLRICAEKVSEYVEATGDDPGRWTDHAPPSFAAVALFAAAPAFLDDPAVRPHATVLIHGDQAFRWLAPWPVEHSLVVCGSLERVRQRAETSFVTFTMTVDDAAGTRVLDGSSTFLMSAAAVPPPEESEEPPARLRAGNERPASLPMPGAGTSVPPLAKSASRLDLMRYAGASRDWNPIHLDHAAAVAAGLEGVVVHGLLAAAWATQAAARLVPGAHPLSEARFRFRAPVRPAVQAVVGGTIETVDREAATLKLGVTAGGVEAVGAQIVVRRA